MRNFLKINRTIFSIFILLNIISLNTLQAQCSTAITGVTISNVYSTTATFSWPAVSPENGLHYHFEIRTAGAPGSSVSPLSGYVLSGDTDNGITSVTINDLNFSTVFYFYIRYECSLTVFSPWQPTGSNTFTTQALQVPVATPALYVSNTTFVAKWNPVAGANSYKLDVSKSPTFASGQWVPGYQNKIVTTASDVVDPSGGLTPSTTYYYRVRAVGIGGQPLSVHTTGYSNTITVTTLATPLPYTVWSEAGWSQDPTFTLDAIIDWDYSTADDGNFEAKSLEVHAGKTLTIDPSTYISLDNQITNNGTLIVESNANLYQENAAAAANVGNVIVKRQSSALYRLDYTMWSSPVTGSQTLQQFSPQTLSNRFYKYNTATDQYVAYSPTNAFVKGEGYLIRMPNNWIDNPAPNPTPAPAKWTGSFTGVPNNKIVTIPLATTGSGFNMVGNPYPCVISAENFLGDNNDAIEGEIYFWRRTNSTTPGVDVGSYYATYTTAGGTAADDDPSNIPNGYIQVGQGFLVQDNSGDASDEVNFYNTQKIPDNFDDQFFKTQNPANATNTLIERNRLWLNLTSDSGVFSQTMVCYMTGASNDLDRADGKYINDSDVALTSAISGGEYVIQSRALPFTDTDVVALQFKTPVAGTYTITLSQVDGLFTGNQNIYIKDNLTNVTHDLKAGAYTFTTEAGIFPSRFIITYGNALGTTNPTFNSNSVVVYNKNRVIYMDSGKLPMQSVVLYDMQGRVIFKKENIDNTKFNISNLNSQEQMIVIQITTDQGVINKKFIFNKE